MQLSRPVNNKNGIVPEGTAASCWKANKWLCFFVIAMLWTTVWQMPPSPALIFDSIASSTTTSESKPLWTAGEMKRFMRLPCNYVHDGFYLSDSNEMANQVYQSLMELKDDAIPLVIEVGGHDGITKSLSLKSSICFRMNTMLIEASPSNYKVLQKARNYDITINKALCEDDVENIVMIENTANSGENKIVNRDHVEANEKKKNKKSGGRISVTCTSIDQELDKLALQLPISQRGKLFILLLILDVEGYETTAIDGINKYSPKKVYIETNKLDEEQQIQIQEWAESHGLGEGRQYGQDRQYKFHPTIEEKKTLQPDQTAFLWCPELHAKRHS